MNYEYDVPREVGSPFHLGGPPRLKMKLTFLPPMRHVTPSWIDRHADQILTWWENAQGLHARMRPIEFYYDRMEIFMPPGSNPQTAPNPQYVEITTAYPLEIHRWAQAWLIPPTQRSSYSHDELQRMRSQMDREFRREHYNSWMNADYPHQMPPPFEPDVVIIDEAYEMSGTEQDPVISLRGELTNESTAQAAATRQANLQVEWGSPVLPSRSQDASQAD